ncbi:uncharacterized protein LOC130824244 isoform X1 [Amaranthus tricolor]|uniref:uncharacterized protein LOC130824244 isoform X1 n=1 Tax=Amaranthus tricolor TaxID=29722 RepID=UPI0025885B26|nr:uncharacterized protein LOC130824244 isoform X1 [Amaranthus tricolor]
MKDDYETEEKKQAAADVLFSYSKFVAACIGNRVHPCDLRMHLMKMQWAAHQALVQRGLIKQIAFVHYKPRTESYVLPGSCYSFFVSLRPYM